MSREAFLIIIAAMIAGAIGFGIAVYAVPLEEIVQFRALVNAGLGGSSITDHPGNGNSGDERPPASPSKELSSPSGDRSGANSSCVPHNVGGSPTEAAIPSNNSHRDDATRNSKPSEKGSSGAEQVPARENEPARFPSLSPNAGCEKGHVAREGHSKRSVKKPKLKDAP